MPLRDVPTVKEMMLCVLGAVIGLGMNIDGGHAEDQPLQITPDARIEIIPAPKKAPRATVHKRERSERAGSNHTPRPNQAAERTSPLPAPAAAPNPSAAAAPDPSPAVVAPHFDFAAQLERAGAKACADRINALGTAVLPGATGVATAANWAMTSPDTRPVDVLVGQKFGSNPQVPFGATGIFAAPSPGGGCEGMSVQVVPSPLSCAKVREALSRKGKQIGDLAGVALMQDATTETMLVSTGAGTCVLVGVRVAYAQ